MNFPRKKNISIILMASLLVAMGLVVWFGILPVKRSIAEKMDDIQKFYTSRENRDRQISKLPELEGQFEAIRADEGSLDILLTEDHIVDFVKTLEGLAKDTNVEIIITAKEGNAIIDKKPASPSTTTADDTNTVTSAADDKKKAAGIMDTLPFNRYLHLSLSVTGQYADIVNFLHKMETLPFALDVVGLEMSPKEGDNQSSSDASSSGSGINPFMVISGNSSENALAAKAVSVKKSLLQAVFDTVVYIDKK